MKIPHLINPLRNLLKLPGFRAADAEGHRPNRLTQAVGALRPRSKTGAWILALTSLTCWNAMAQNLVSNPGFESGTPSTYYAAGSTDLPGWTVNTTPSDGVQLYTASDFGVTQTPNTLVLQLTGGPDYAGGGGVQQSIATTPGVTYTISIDVANRQNGSVTGNFSFGGQNHALSASSKTFTTQAWAVTATSATTLIDITGSTSSGSIQLIIDNVSVTPPVAEVASAANSSVTAAPASVPADGTSTSTITVTLRDADNVPVANKIVTLAKTAGPGTPTITTISGITSASGDATFTVASTTAGAAVFTATDVTDGNLIITETATVTFVAPAPITWGTPTTIAGDSDLSTTGTLKYAYHWANNGDQIVNGVYFFATTSFTSGGGDVGLAGFAQQADFFNSSSAPFIDLSGPYQSILAGSAVNYTGSPVNITVTLQNLTPGIQYAVQVWSQNPRGDTEPQLATTLASFGGNSVALDHNSLNADGGLGQYSIGTFTATSTTQTFTLSSLYPMLNALQVRDLSGVVDDYATWSGPSGYNLAEGPTGDDDKDGLTNQEEYAFGLVPINGASVNPITVQLNKTAKTFSYTRRDTTKTDLNYSVWFSTNLSTWTEDTGATEGTPVLTGEVETVQVTLSNLPGDPLPPTLFIQVRAD